MRILQASPSRFPQAIEQAQRFDCTRIAWNLREACEAAVLAARQSGIESVGWLQVARDEAAIMRHPEWMHCPQHHEWLRRFPDFRGGHPALVAPYIGLNTRPAFEYAVENAVARIRANPWAHTVWLADIQGAPMGCGCGNPCCRSWDNAPGEKLAPTPYLHPTTFFSAEFVNRLAAELTDFTPRLNPILCPECERGVTVDTIDDPDGPDGTDLCQGIPCVRPCALDYFPNLLAAFRAARGEGGDIGLLALTDALGKNHPVFGEPRAWARRAQRHYGLDLLPCIEPPDAFAFERALIVTDAPQDCYPVAPPVGYVPELPPIMCGYCPPEG